VNGKRSMDGSATPIGLTDISQESWALYYSKFITAYKKLGISIWALTVQNEPENPAVWEACVETPEFQRDFIVQYLGPQLALDHPEVIILGFDHNRDSVLNWYVRAFASSRQE